MGATPEQGDDACGGEKPPHEVKLTRDYYIGQTPVTQGLWQAVMGSNPSCIKGDNRPVESVSWNDCRDFIEKLNGRLSSELDERRFRLPTEAEWEYAARGGNKSKGYKYSGSNNLDDVAWYDDNSGFETHEVAKKQANELGLYDMSGNVQTDPQGPNSGYFRMNRGGGWIFSARVCRVSYRNFNTPDGSCGFLGIRLVLSE